MTENVIEDTEKTGHAQDQKTLIGTARGDTGIAAGTDPDQETLQTREIDGNDTDTARALPVDENETTVIIDDDRDLLKTSSERTEMVITGCHHGHHVGITTTKRGTVAVAAHPLMTIMIARADKTTVSDLGLHIVPVAMIVIVSPIRGLLHLLK